MSSFGLYGGFPFTFGDNSEDPLVVEHAALLAALEPALDPSEGTVHEAETFAEARTLSMIWDAGERLANQAIPARMLEALPDAEEIYGLIPAPSSTDNDRRAAVEAKTRGLGGNSLPDIEDAARALLGANFVELVLTPREDAVVYWPGGIPGPPGYEWMNTVAHLGIRVNTTGLGPTSGPKLGVKLFGLLDPLIPTWMTYAVGVGDEFIVGEGIVGLTLI